MSQGQEQMRAVKIVAHGAVGGLEVQRVAKPEACADQVLVRVRAAALNRADILQRRGRYPAPPGAPADIPGLEFAGEIEAVGAQVQGLRAGQPVFGITAGGAQSEYVVLPESHCAEIPSNLNFVEAAAVPEAFITAHDALFTQAGLRAGERVLIHAVGSGVGLAALQLAHAINAETFGTARTSAKLERASQEFGLVHAIVVQDDPARFVQVVEEATTGRGVDVIVDLVGASYFVANLEALAMRGRLMLVGTLGGARAELDYSRVMGKRATLTGTVLRGRSAEEKARAVRLFAAQVMPLLARGVVRPVIDSVFPLEEVQRAHLRLEANETFGKIVLQL